MNPAKILLYLILIILFNACIINAPEHNDNNSPYESILLKLTSQFLTNDIKITIKKKVATININYDSIPVDDFLMALPASSSALLLYEEIQKNESIDSIYVKLKVNSISDSIKIHYSINDLNSCQKYLIKIDEFVDKNNSKNWEGIKEFFQFNQDEQYIDLLINKYIKKQRVLFGKIEDVLIQGCFFTEEYVSLYFLSGNKDEDYSYILLILDKKTASPLDLGFNDLTSLK